MTLPRPPRVFRVTGALVLLIISAAVVLALLVDAGVRAGAATALWLAPWPLLVLWAVYVVGVASDVRADATGVRVQNLLRRTWVPWARVQRVAMRWQVEFVLDDGGVLRCFGGPARTRARRLGPGRTKEAENDEHVDGVAALNRLRSSAEPVADARIRRGWDAGAIIVLAVLVGWAAVAVVVTR